MALTYILESGGMTFPTVYAGDYLDDGSSGQITNTQPLVTHTDSFDIGFDPMLTWLSEDVLVWRTDPTVSTLFFCNVTEYPADESFGVISIDNANAPTDFLLSGDGTTVYFYGRGNAVSSVPNPANVDEYDAQAFYVDDIEYTISNLAFSPSGKYFLVGNRSRLRCFDASDPSVRYRWWEDSDLERSLDEGSLELLDIWWQ